MNVFIPYLRKIRAFIMKTVKPKNSYFLFKPAKSLEPISGVFGFDRGKPLDRYYIESFLDEHKSEIKGRCLEVHDDAYCKQFGGNKVTKADIVDIDEDNKLANIYADLSKADHIPSDTYDTLVITHTLGLIPEQEKAIGHMYRILKPGGKLILTVSAMGPYLVNGSGFWRYTEKSVPYLLGKFFKPAKTTMKVYGNVLSGQAFWVGLSADELTKKELDYYDPRFPMVIASISQK